MIVCFLIPVLIGVKSRWCCHSTCTKVFSDMSKSYAKAFIPLIAILTILMVIPTVLLSKSNLCGLGYQQELDSSDDHDCDDDDLVGTYALVREDIPAICELGTSGMGTAVAMGVWPLVLIAQASILKGRSAQLAKKEEDSSHELPVVKKIAIDDDFIVNSKDEQDKHFSAQNVAVY